jgi:hypothetical protein
MIAAFLLTSGAMIIVFTILASLHAANPARYGAAGGVSHLHGFAMALGQLGSIAAILVGSAAGAGDVAAGVFRSLVATGRSRVALFFARVPAGLLITLMVVALAYLLVAVALVVFAGYAQAPTIGQLVSWGLWVELQAVMLFVVALGFSSLVVNQAVTIGVLLAWQLILTPILNGIRVLPNIRQVVLGVALEQLQPRDLGLFADQFRSLTMSGIAIAVVLVLWAAGALVVGGWRTATRDA